jgi:hypothetical protein
LVLFDRYVLFRQLIRLNLFGQLVQCCRFYPLCRLFRCLQFGRFRPFGLWCRLNQFDRFGLSDPLIPYFLFVQLFRLDQLDPLAHLDHQILANPLDPLDLFAL